MFKSNNEAQKLIRINGDVVLPVTDSTRSAAAVDSTDSIDSTTTFQHIDEFKFGHE